MVVRMMSGFSRWRAHSPWASVAGHLDRRRTGQKHLLAGRQFSDPWHLLSLQGNHHGVCIHHDECQFNLGRQGAGTEWSGYIQRRWRQSANPGGPHIYRHLQNDAPIFRDRRPQHLAVFSRDAAIQPGFLSLTNWTTIATNTPATNDLDVHRHQRNANGDSTFYRAFITMALRCGSLVPSGEGCEH
jgi:hypothetical protein